MASSRESIIDLLLASDEPSILWKTRVGILGEDPVAKKTLALREQVRRSLRVSTLLSRQDAKGRIAGTRSVYDKWQGAHWVLARLADIGYPEGDDSLLPMRNRVVEHWLSEGFYLEFEATSKADAYKKKVGVPVMEGRHRRCASQQAYALFSVIKLGIADSRVDDLAERLLHWQWPDGGWNCDKEPSASCSTFIHTIHGLRALHLYGVKFQKPKARAAVKAAAEVFLSRDLFKRRSTGETIREEFTKLHYPVYWHYDILFALKVMAESGLIGDPRCEQALSLLESKRLPNGAWAANSAYYKVSQKILLNADFVDWGGTSQARMNPWVTVDALTVLKAAGRWRP